MNKKFMHNSLCASFFVIFSITCSPSLGAFWTGSSFTFLGDIIDEMNETIDDHMPMLFYTRKAPALEAVALHGDLNTLEAEAVAMQKEIIKLRNMLLNSKAEKEDALSKVKVTKEKLEQSLASCSNILAQFEKDAQTITEKHAYNIKEYNAQEAATKDDSKYGVVISVPGFKPDDLTVSINIETKQGATKQQLIVTGTKQVPTSTSQDKITTDHHFTSSSFINGRQKQIEYKNGSIKATFDLPLNIDTKEGSYTMAFDHQKETLTIEFNKTDKTQKTILKYTPKSSSHHLDEK